MAEKKSLKELREDREEILKKIDDAYLKVKILKETYGKIQAKIKEEEEKEIKKAKDKILGGK